MEAAGEGLVETASDASSSTTSATSSQEFLDGIESATSSQEFLDHLETLFPGPTETASDASSSTTSATSSQEFLDGMPDEIRERIFTVHTEPPEETMSSPTELPVPSEAELERMSKAELDELAAGLLKQRLRFDALVSNISTCEVINVLGVNKDKLEEIRDVHRRITLLESTKKLPTQEDEDKWTDIGLEATRLLTAEGGEGN